MTQPGQNPTPGGGGTVLLVDDDESLLAAMSRLLRPDGLRVLIATGGERALELLEAEGDSIGVVVSDYQMPGMNGADLLRAVRLRWPDVTRILATGNADLTAAARTVNEGQVSRLITKPCDPDQFREVVGAALTQHHLVLENRRLREVADEQSIRLEQWNQRLEETVTQRTAELEQANAGCWIAYASWWDFWNAGCQIARADVAKPRVWPGVSPNAPPSRPRPFAGSS